MKKSVYKINDRVMVFDTDWIITGTITDINRGLFCVEYDGGGYDWLLADEIRPLEYQPGDYVKTSHGVGKVYHADELGMLIVGYGHGYAFEHYYEHEVKPVCKPSLWARLLRKDVYMYAK